MARSGGEIHRTVLCDTNVLVRFLTADSPHHSPAARRAIEAAAAGRIAIVITDVVVAEVVFVLTSVHRLAESEVANRLVALLGLPGIECSDFALLEDALHLWSHRPIDFVDAYLGAINRATQGTAVLSFDRDFDRTEGVERVDPTRY